MQLLAVQRALRALADPAKARILRRFFKTGAGEYGEGDRFIGVTVPRIRRVAAAFADLSESGVATLLRSPCHEERLAALLILVRRFERGDAVAQKRVFRLYLWHLPRVNNWDLVDLSAPHIVGEYLLDRSRRPLYRLATASNLWSRRVAIVATYAFIRRNDFTETLAIADRLLGDREDLIHKAVGWMLREVGKRSQAAAERYLQKRYRHLPRTMLRYAIERFPESLRRRYLAGTVGARPAGRRRM
jgi:3-methyladenine DNA glycosylase AlkD